MKILKKYLCKVIYYMFTMLKTYTVTLYCQQYFYCSHITLCFASCFITFFYLGSEVFQAENGNQYKCTSCNRVYLHKGNLIKHQRYECGDLKPFTCDFCPYRSKQKGHLKLHLFSKHNQTTQS